MAEGVMVVVVLFGATLLLLAFAAVLKIIGRL